MVASKFGTDLVGQYGRRIYRQPGVGLAFVIICYLVATCFLLLSWNQKRQYGPTGDEPHYLIVASAIADHGEFEISAAYRDEFNRPRYHPGLARPGDALVRSNSHSMPGPHGLYSIHSIGLPLLLAPLVALGQGTGSARLLMVFLSLIVPVIAWRSAAAFIEPLGQRIIVAGAIALSAPFIYAAGQIYPDLPAGGIFAFVAIGLMRERFGKSLENDVTQEQRWFASVLAAVLLAFAPWLQIKFSAPVLVCVAARLLLGPIPARRRSGIAITWLALPMASLAALALYNHYAFGKFSGSYVGNAIELSQTAFAVLIGLHIDQFQGIFLTAPILLAAPIGLAALLRCDWRLASFLAILYASLVVPNAMHPTWYGAWSFAGRYVLAGGVVLIIPAVYGMALLMRLRPRLTVWLCGLYFGLQALLWLGYRSGHPNLYNNARTFEGLGIAPPSSFYEPIGRLLPYIDRRDLTLLHWPNLAWLLALVCLCVGGWLIATVRPGQKSGAWRWLLAAPVLMALGGLAALSETDPPRILPSFDAAQLPGLVGSVDGNGRTARAGRDPAGTLTYGPYVVLPPGRYAFRLAYVSPAARNRSIGYWDVSLAADGKIATGNILGTDGRREEIADEFQITGIFSQITEIRSFFNGQDEMTILKLEIKKTK